MDGENKGKPYEQMDDLGGKENPIFGNTLVKFSQNRPSKPFSPLGSRYLWRHNHLHLGRKSRYDDFSVFPGS